MSLLLAACVGEKDFDWPGNHLSAVIEMFDVCLCQGLYSELFGVVSCNLHEMWNVRMKYLLT